VTERASDEITVNMRMVCEPVGGSRLQADASLQPVGVDVGVK